MGVEVIYTLVSVTSGFEKLTLTLSFSGFTDIKSEQIYIFVFVVYCLCAFLSFLVIKVSTLSPTKYIYLTVV